MSSDESEVDQPQQRETRSYWDESSSGDESDARLSSGLTAGTVRAERNADTVDDDGVGEDKKGHDRRLLEAFRVALQQETCRRKPWYVSTRELELASIGLCSACRTVATFHVTVEKGSPKSLVIAPASGKGRRRRTSSRVPPLRALRVTWRRSPKLFALAQDTLLERVDHLTLGSEFGRFLWEVCWPKSLRRLDFEDRADVRMARVATHRFVVLETRLNVPIDKVAWPPSLRELALGDRFAHSVQRVAWPSSLEKLSFGKRFNARIDRVVWPASLRELELGKRFNRPIEEVLWPASLLRLTLSAGFDKPIEGVAWPASLEELVFGARFNRPIGGVLWPGSLRVLRFGEDFNQPIYEVRWPASLERLTLGEQFNQPVEDVRWPVALRVLAFGRWFNHEIDRARWPPSLQELRFGDGFGRSIVGVAWPASLVRLILPSSYFTLNLVRVVWPESMKTLELGEIVLHFSKPGRLGLLQHCLRGWKGGICCPSGALVGSSPV